MEEQLSQLEQRMNTAWAEIVKMEERLNAITSSTTRGDEALNGQMQSLASAKDQAEQIKIHYTDYHSKTDPTIKSKLEQVLEHHSTVEQFLKASTELKNELQEFRDFVYGNETIGKEGFKKELDSFYIKSVKGNKDFLEAWAETYNTLLKKIEGLLPGATSTGLAKAYEDQSKNYTIPVYVWSGIFILMMIFMIYIAIDTMKSSATIVDSLLGILARLPFFIPAVWLALFASKQQSQYKRLSQEYAYKQTLAKSFEGYKREIQSLPEGDEKNRLLDKLTTAMVEMCAYNPSITLDSKTHNDKPPIPILQELMVKLDEMKNRNPTNG